MSAIPFHFEMPSENKELLLVAQRGSEASSDKENEDHHDNTTKLDMAVRALAHARTQFDQARVLHAKAASDLDELRDQLNDPNLDPFERELLEEDLDHLTSELARQGRRAEAWESKSTIISAEISVRRARMPATGKSEAETTYDSVEELEPSPETSDHGPGPSTLELNSTAKLSDQTDGIGSPELSTVRPYQIDAAAKAARQVIMELSPTPQPAKSRSGESVGPQDQRAKGADAAHATLMARRNLNPELTSQVHTNTGGEPSVLGEIGAQVGPSGTATKTENVPATRMTKTNPVAEAGEARKDAKDGQDDCVHGLGGAPSSGPDQTTTTAPLSTDRPTPTLPGADGGQLTARKDQPLASSPPSTTYDRDAPPDQHHHYQPVGTPCDASGESVPTTAETKKPPGHLKASGPTALTQTGGVNTAEGDSNHQGQTTAQPTASTSTATGLGAERGGVSTSGCTPSGRRR